MSNGYIYNDPNDIIFLPFQEDMNSTCGQEPGYLNNGVCIVTDEKPQGALSSIYCPAAEGLRYDDLPINFSEQDEFTIDFYMRYQTGYSGISSIWQGNGFSIQNNLIWIGTTKYVNAVSRNSLLANEWAHYALSRKNGICYWFINGELIDSAPNTDSLFSTRFFINSRYVLTYRGGNSHYAFVRISNIARWTDNFTPPDPSVSTPTNYTIMERYQTLDSVDLQAETTKTIASGDGYAATAPIIDDYNCIGYKIDSGSLQPVTTATIASVTQNHEVVFIYKQKQQGGNDGSVPAGMIMYFTDTLAPEGWLKCDGSAISRTDYQNLFNVVGTKFGEGDALTTFNLPDLRAQFIRGFDDDKGIDEGRSFGSYQPGSLLMNDSDSVTNTPDLVALDARYNPTETLSHDKVENLSEYPNLKHYIKQPDSTRIAIEDAVEPVSGFFGVARPKNIALLPCIKY